MKCQVCNEHEATHAPEGERKPATCGLCGFPRYHKRAHPYPSVPPMSAGSIEAGWDAWYTAKENT